MKALPAPCSIVIGYYLEIIKCKVSPVSDTLTRKAPLRTSYTYYIIGGHMWRLFMHAFSKEKGRQRETPPKACTPESSLLSSAGAPGPGSSNNSLLGRWKLWQTQFILVNVYFSFVYICTYTYTAVFIYDRHVKYSWRWGLGWVGNTYEVRTELF